MYSASVSTCYCKLKVINENISNQEYNGLMKEKQRLVAEGFGGKMRPKIINPGQFFFPHVTIVTENPNEELRNPLYSRRRPGESLVGFHIFAFFPPWDFI